jgi:PTS system mannose-specific IIA component
MVGILILSHGSLAEELLASARVISGDLPDFAALTLGWHDSVDEARRKVGALLPTLDHGEGVLILTDMYGSTPFNVALGFRQAGKVEVVSGVNLPMVVRLGCLTSKAMPVSEMASWIRDKGRSSICGSRNSSSEPDGEVDA